MTDRVAALVAALLGVRTDHASARFDAEIDAALNANRLDVQTARALRFWQRASVQAVEEYAGAVLPAALVSRDDADRQGAAEMAQAAAAWEQAQRSTATPAAAHIPETPQNRLLAVRYTRSGHQPIKDTRATKEARSIKETEQAVRAALQVGEKDRDHASSATST
jgi:hypothetical protein